MKIEMWPLRRLKPYPKNPRMNNDAVEPVARSIREFGFRQPIVVDKKGVIIIGHVRLKAAKLLGLKTVPVHVAGDLNPAQVGALRIADNRLNETAEWDVDLLSVEIAQLQSLSMDVDILGFTQAEMADVIDFESSASAEESEKEIKRQWTVIIDCSNEAEQRRLIRRFQGEHLSVRAANC